MVKDPFSDYVKILNILLSLPAFMRILLNETNSRLLALCVESLLSNEGSFSLIRIYIYFIPTLAIHQNKKLEKFTILRELFIKCSFYFILNDWNFFEN